MEKFIRIEQPKLIRNWLIIDQIGPKTLNEAVSKSEHPEYLHWEKIKYKNWFPTSVSKEAIWTYIKTSRQIRAEKTPILDVDGNYFEWVRLNRYEEFLHRTDLELGGNLVGMDTVSEQDKKVLRAQSIMEEAISSSQLEGAHTTRMVAKKMLQEGRLPRNKAEKMIFNNYKTMSAIEQEYQTKPLSLDMLFELHALITKGTLEPEKQGRFRTDEENFVVSPKGDEEISFKPPSIAFVKEQIIRLIAFANDELDSKFIHPVIKAIMIHFWIGFLHPFCDGNGRLARVLFYWYLLRKNYWAFAYLPISEKIKKSPAQYSWAYIYSEQDDHDLTYFIDYNIRQIQAARKDFEKYVKKKIAERQTLQELVPKTMKSFNQRQIQVMSYLFRDNNAYTNVSSYMHIFQITKATAINDLKDLLKRGFLYIQKSGRNVFYYPTEKLKKVFKKN